MVNRKEILRLKSLGLTHREIVDAAGCGRNTVTRTLARAREQKLDWQQAQSMSQQEVSQCLFPTEQKNPAYKMPDYEWVHREMQKSGVTLGLLWMEYCEQCHCKFRVQSSTCTENEPCFHGDLSPPSRT